MKALPTALLILAPLVAPQSAAQEAGPVLTVEQARARSDRVGDVGYEFAVRLDGIAPAYAGSVRVTFDLADASSDLRLDFGGGTVLSVVVNGAEVDGRYNGHHLTLPGGALVRGRNEAVVRFSRPYSADGTGLYRFVDPEEFQNLMRDWIARLRDARLVPGAEPVRFPGERSHRLKERRQREGIELTGAVVDDLSALGKKFGCRFPDALSS